MKHRLHIADTIREAVFGANDGVVSTFGILSGLAGAALSNQLIVLVGIVQVIAAGLSMGLGAYISTKSQNEYVSAEQEKIKSEIDVHPAREKMRLNRTLKKTGLKGERLHRVADELTKSRKAWTHFLLEDRVGMAQENLPHPVLSGAVMFLAFLIAGTIVVVPFAIINNQGALIVSATISLATLFFVGAAKTQFTHRNAWVSGMENLLIGLATGVVGYAVGVTFQGLL